MNMGHVGSISVGNKKWGCVGEYIGRGRGGKPGSPLANQFVMRDQSDAERNRVCDAYDVWLDEMIRKRDPNVCAELNRLYRMLVSGQDLVLVCWCAPKRCHGDSIKRVLEEALERRDTHK